MANVVTNKGCYIILDSSLALLTDTIKCILLSSTHTPSRTINFIDEGGASDMVDARIGTDQTLGNKSITEDDSNNRAYLDADDPVWTAVAGGSTITNVGIYKDTGTPTTAPVIGYYDVTDTATNGGNITLQFAVAGSGGALYLA
jgi:hypothetical protein